MTAKVFFKPHQSNINNNLLSCNYFKLILRAFTRVKNGHVAISLDRYFTYILSNRDNEKNPYAIVTHPCACYHSL